MQPFLQPSLWFALADLELRPQLRLIQISQYLFILYIPAPDLLVVWSPIGVAPAGGILLHVVIVVVVHRSGREIACIPVKEGLDDSFDTRSTGSLAQNVHDTELFRKRGSEDCIMATD